VPTRNPVTREAFVHDLLLGANPAPLSGAGRVALFVRYRFVLAADAASRRHWRVRIIGYFHTLREIDGPELFGYHWHPEGASHETAPHLHLGAALRPGRTDILKAHLPTSHVHLPDILRFAIRDLGVRPLRRDWRSVLDEPRDVLASPDI
jgi:hypothetical protein